MRGSALSYVSPRWCCRLAFAEARCIHTSPEPDVVHGAGTGAGKRAASASEIVLSGTLGIPRSASAGAAAVAV
ncbi:MAG: hypothetical protein ACYDHN_11930 [Solirubrobacteraceae bacterium]